MGEVKVKICPFGLVVLIPIDIRKTGNYKTGTCRNWQKNFFNFSPIGRFFFRKIFASFDKCQFRNFPFFAGRSGSTLPVQMGKFSLLPHPSFTSHILNFAKLATARKKISISGRSDEFFSKNFCQF